MREKFPDALFFWIPAVSSGVAAMAVLPREEGAKFTLAWMAVMLAMSFVWAVFSTAYTAAERRIGTLLKKLLGQEGYDMRLKLTPKLGGVEHSVSTYSATSDLQTTEIFSLKFSWFSTLLRHKYVAAQLHSYSLLLESKWRKKLDDVSQVAGAGGSGAFSPQLWGSNLLKQYSQALGMGLPSQAQGMLGQGLHTAAEQAMKQNYAQHKIAQQQSAMNNALNKLNAATQALDDMEP